MNQRQHAPETNLRLPLPQGQTGNFSPASHSSGGAGSAISPAERIRPSRRRKESDHCTRGTGRLSLLRRYRPDRRGEARVLRGIDRAVLRLRARGIFSQIIVVLPVARRSRRSRRKASAAVRADVVQHSVDTGCAERALVAADPGAGRVGREGRGAALAGGLQLQHVAEYPGRGSRRQRRSADDFRHRARRSGARLTPWTSW